MAEVFPERGSHEGLLHAVVHEQCVELVAAHEPDSYIFGAVKMLGAGELHSAGYIAVGEVGGSARICRQH